MGAPGKVCGQKHSPNRAADLARETGPCCFRRWTPDVSGHQTLDPRTSWTLNWLHSHQNPRPPFLLPPERLLYNRCRLESLTLDSKPREGVWPSPSQGPDLARDQPGKQVSARHTSQGGRWAPPPTETRRVGTPQSQGGASGMGPENSPRPPQSCLGSQAAGERKAKVTGRGGGHRTGEAWGDPRPAPRLPLPEQRAVCCR